MSAGFSSIASYSYPYRSRNLFPAFPSTLQFGPPAHGLLQPLKGKHQTRLGVHHHHRWFSGSCLSTDETVVCAQCRHGPLIIRCCLVLSAPPTSSDAVGTPAAVTECLVISAALGAPGSLATLVVLPSSSFTHYIFLLAHALDLVASFSSPFLSGFHSRCVRPAVAMLASSAVCLPRLPKIWTSFMHQLLQVHVDHVNTIFYSKCTFLPVALSSMSLPSSSNIADANDLVTSASLKFPDWMDPFYFVLF